MDGEAQFWRDKYLELLVTHTHVVKILSNDDKVARVQQQVDQAKGAVTQIMGAVREAQAKQQANGAQPTPGAGSVVPQQ